MNEKDDNIFADELVANAAKLQTTAEPERDLWPEIEQVISAPLKPQRSAWNTVWAQAAAVLLLVGGSSGLTYLTMTDAEDPATPVLGTQNLIFEPVSGSFGSQYHLGPDYIDARRDVAGRFDVELENLSPEARQEVQTNIETIRRAIEDINHALAQEPDNVLLQELLIDTYRDELTLMIQVDGINRSAMRRGDI